MSGFSKIGRAGQIGLASAAGLLMAALQSGSAQAALVTTNFVWNGTGVPPGSEPFKLSGVFTYDDSLATATILPNGMGPGGYGSTATGFKDFVINSLMVNGLPVAAFTPKQVVDGTGLVVNPCTSACSLANNITFNTATQTFETDPIQQFLGVETLTSNLSFGETPAGTFSLNLGGGEYVGSAQSSTGLTIPPTSAVPGPLPILGASMAWSLSRRLRKQVKLSTADRSLNSIS